MTLPAKKRLALVWHRVFQATLVAALLVGLGPFAVQGFQEVIARVWEADAPVWLASMKTLLVASAAVLAAHNAIATIRVIPLPRSKR